MKLTLAEKEILYRKLRFDLDVLVNETQQLQLDLGINNHTEYESQLKLQRYRDLIRFSHGLKINLDSLASEIAANQVIFDELQKQIKDLDRELRMLGQDYYLTLNNIEEVQHQLKTIQLISDQHVISLNECNGDLTKLQNILLQVHHINNKKLVLEEQERFNIAAVTKCKQRIELITNQINFKKLQSAVFDSVISQEYLNTLREFIENREQLSKPQLNGANYGADNLHRNEQQELIQAESLEPINEIPVPSEDEIGRWLDMAATESESTIELNRTYASPVDNAINIGTVQITLLHKSNDVNEPIIHSTTPDPIKIKLDYYGKFFTPNHIWQRAVFVITASTVPDACALARNEGSVLKKLKDEEYPSIEWVDESTPRLNNQDLPFYTTFEIVDKLNGSVLMRGKPGMQAQNYRLSLLVTVTKKSKRAVLELCNVKLADINDNCKKNSFSR